MVHCCCCCANGTHLTSSKLGSKSWITNCLCPVNPALSREWLRTKYGISSSFLDDTLVPCCCPALSLIQEIREVKGRGGYEKLAAAVLKQETAIPQLQESMARELKKNEV